MTHWDGLFAAPLKTASPQPARKTGPVLHLAMDELPQLDVAAIANWIDALEPVGAPTIGRAAPPSASEPLIAAVRFGPHQVDLIGVPNAVDHVGLEEILRRSHWPDEEKERLRAHRVHIVCHYHGIDENPVEQYLALYKVAGALRDSLLGVVNRPAATFHPPEFVDVLCRPDVLASCRVTIPLHLWTGFVKFFTERGTWYLSRGFHLFGLQDFAFFGRNERPSEVHQLFARIFNLVFGKPQPPRVGDTIQLDAESFLAFQPVTELQTLLASPSGVLVLEYFEREDSIH